MHQCTFIGAGRTFLGVCALPFLVAGVSCITGFVIDGPAGGVAAWWIGVIAGLSCSVLGLGFLWRGFCCWVVVDPSKRMIRLARGRRVGFDEVDTAGIVLAPPAGLYDREVPLIVLRSGDRLRVSELMTRVGSRVNDRFLDVLKQVLPPTARVMDDPAPPPPVVDLKDWRGPRRGR